MQPAATLNPTPDQTFELEGRGPYDFVSTLSRSLSLQRGGEVEKACNLRFQAFQRLVEVIPEDEEVILEWNHANSRAALELLRASAIDHFLIDDFEMSAAQLEMLLDLDPEDHLAASEQLAFDYVAMDERELFDEVIGDVPEGAEQTLLRLWSAFRRTGQLPGGQLERFRSRCGAWYAEFTAAEHPADGEYLRDIESLRPTAQARARELWLRTENLWRRWPDFIEALSAAK